MGLPMKNSVTQVAADLIKLIFVINLVFSLLLLSFPLWSTNNHRETKRDKKKTSCCNA